MHLFCFALFYFTTITSTYVFFIALVKSHSKLQKCCLLSYVEHNSLLFFPAFIFIPYLKTLLLTCIIKVGPLSVTMAYTWLFFFFFKFPAQWTTLAVSMCNIYCARKTEFNINGWTLYFCFPPLDGDKLFPTVGIGLLSITSTSCMQISNMHHSALQTNEVLSCKSVIILCSAKGCIVQTLPSEFFLQELLMFKLFDGRRDVGVHSWQYIRVLSAFLFCSEFCLLFSVNF